PDQPVVVDERVVAVIRAVAGAAPAARQAARVAPRLLPVKRRGAGRGPGGTLPAARQRPSRAGAGGGTDPVGAVAGLRPAVRPAGPLAPDDGGGGPAAAKTGGEAAAAADAGVGGERPVGWAGHAGAAARPAAGDDAV